MTLAGRRVAGDTGPHRWEPGDYGRRGPTLWFGITPSGYIANLSEHQVTEHEDGTITVVPSIRVALPKTEELPERELWHGHLERGVWRSV